MLQEAGREWPTGIWQILMNSGQRASMTVCSYRDEPIRVCGKAWRYGCSWVMYTTYGFQYQQVCGRIRGYQKYATTAFQAEHRIDPCTIDDSYVYGVSITYRNAPRKHIWTCFNEIESSSSACPCNGGQLPPEFVGSDYYCESGITIRGYSVTFTPMIHSGMDWAVKDVRPLAVTPPTSPGSASRPSSANYWQLGTPYLWR